MRRRCKCGARRVAHATRVRGDHVRLYCLSCHRRVTVARSLSLRTWLLRVLA